MQLKYVHEIASYLQLKSQSA